MPMAYGRSRRRISAFQFLSRLRNPRRSNLYQYGITKRRRFIRASGRYPVYRRYTRYVNRPLGNPLAITERKYHDLERTSVTIQPCGTNWSACLVDPFGPGPSGGTIPAFTFNAIPVGTSFQQRIGRKVQLVSLKFKGEIGMNTGIYNPAQPIRSQVVRVVFYIDMQTNGIPTSNPGELLFSGPSAAGAGVHYFQNADNFGRFKIIYDQKYVLNPISLYNYNSNEVYVNTRSKIIDWTYNFSPPLTVHYNSANTVTNSDIIDNSIHLAVGCDNLDPSCFINYRSRVVYFDA